MTARDVHREHAREARRIVEHALDAAGWPWSERLSRWIDGLIVIEENAR
jgi:hypothetical protein